MDNGDQDSGHKRLDRIERALELILDDHIKFREELKWLLNSQVLLHGSIEELRTGIAELRTGMQQTHADIVELRAGMQQTHADVVELRASLRDVGATVRDLTRNVEAMRENFDARLTRLEQR